MRDLRRMKVAFHVDMLMLPFHADMLMLPKYRGDTSQSMIDGPFPTLIL
jgi:hypothetical protein